MSRHVRVWILAAGGFATVAWVGIACGAGGGSSAPSSGSCGEGGWARAAEGQPASAAARRPGYFVWHNGHGWHLLTIAKGTRLTGSVTASDRIHLRARPSGTDDRIAVKPSSISFDLGGPTPKAIDFTATCAARVSFALGASNAPPPAVYLGARGRAPAHSFALRRPAATGIEGQILVGPTCPVVGVGADCQDKPGKGTVRIETAPSSRSDTSAGKLVGTVQSDARGRFAKTLPSGRYTVAVVTSGSTYPLAKPTIVDVVPGVVTRVVALLDTGIR